MRQREQLLLRGASVRFAAQQEIERTEALVHVLLRKEFLNGGKERHILLRVEQIQYRAAHLHRFETQQGSEICAVVRHEILFLHDARCRLRCRAEELDDCRFLHRRLWPIEQKEGSPLPRVGEGENGRNAVCQCAVRRECGEDHSLCKCILCECHPVPREDARTILYFLAFHLFHCTCAEGKECDGFLLVLKIHCRVEVLGKIFWFGHVEISRYIGQIAGDHLHRICIECAVCNLREHALCDVPLICLILHRSEKVRDEQDRVRSAACEDLLHARHQLREIAAPFVPKPDHRLHVVCAAEQYIRFLRVAQHAQHECKLFFVYAVRIVAADADGRCNRAAHGREADQIVLLNNAHHIDEMFLPSAVHRLTDGLPQSLLQSAGEQELSDEFDQLRAIRLENGAEYIVGEHVRIVLADEHIMDDGEHFLIAAVEPEGKLFGRERGAFR